MPRGKKICPSCQQENGVRANTCSNCSHEFEVKHKQTKQKPQEKEQQQEQTKKKQDKSLSARSILIPKGHPPFRPEGYNGKHTPVWRLKDVDPWPEPATDEQIKSWAQGVYEHGREHGLKYTANAIKYWARYFWQPRTEDLQRVYRIIDEMFVQTEESVS